MAVNHCAAVEVFCNLLCSLPVHRLGLTQLSRDADLEKNIQMKMDSSILCRAVLVLLALPSMQVLKTDGCVNPGLGFSILH